MTGADRTRGSAVRAQLFASDAYSPVRWRLLSGNNRELGRSATDFADVESCVLGLKETIHLLESLRTRIVPAAGNRWTWQLDVAGTAYAVAGHTFDRRTRCREACARFVAAVRDADVELATTLTVPSHSRALAR